MQPRSRTDAAEAHETDPPDAELARLRRENEALRAELAAARGGGEADPERFRWLADQLPAIVWRADARDQVEFLNLAWVTYTGASTAASIAGGFAAHVHPDDLPTLAAQRAVSLATGRPVVFEYRLRRADGAYRWHLARLVPEHDAGGAIRRWYGTATDVHAIKEADAELAAAEERARAIIEQAMFSVQILGPDGRTRSVNRAWEALWGLTLADLRAIDYDMRGDPQLAEKGILPYILRGFAGEALAIPTIRYVTADTGLAGTARHVRAFIYPVRDAAGDVREVVLMHEDVTAAAEAEQALQVAHRRLADQAAALEAEVARRTQELAAQKALTDRIIQHAPVAMAFFDRDLVYRWNNARHDQVMGLAREGVVGRPVTELLPPATLATMLPLYREALASGEPRTLPAVPGRDGVSWWDCSYVPVLDEHGQAQGILVLAVDATPRLEGERLREAQIDALKQADRAKDEFLSVISHELRTPLNFITGFGSILQDELRGPLNAGQHEAVDKIMAGSDRMLLLVDDLLDFAKIQAGHLDLETVATTYAPLLDEVLGQLAPLATRRGIALAAEVAPELRARADGPRVLQVLTNLVGNALKFTDAGGRVTLRAFVRGEQVVTEVRDTGRGIAAADRDRLFRRFQQLDMSRTRAAGGTGLGLAISKAIVEAHGGAIGVESEPGVGSTFWFTLPAG